jgi:hypothetical protein
MTTDQTTAQEALLPCPFCGGKAQVHTTRSNECSYFNVICPLCSVWTRQFQDRGAAISKGIAAEGAVQ